jgi:hypothetical protein
MSSKRTLSDDSDNEQVDSHDLYQKKKSSSNSNTSFNKRKQEDLTNDFESARKMQKSNSDSQKPSNIGEKLLVLNFF